MKFLIILILINIAASANYMQAKLYYKTANYEAAIQELRTSISEYTNPKLHLLWAKSAQALGHTIEAMSAYERVIILDEKNIDAKLALLKIYKQTKREELADDLVKELQKDTLSIEQKKILSSLKQENTSAKLSVEAAFSSGYDTNVNVSAQDSVLNDFGLQGGEIATLFSQVNSSVNYQDNLYENTNWYYMGTATLFAQENFDASDFNMILLGLNAGVLYKTTNYSLYLPLNYEAVHYFNVNLFTQIKLAPLLQVQVSKNILLETALQYVQLRYIDKRYQNADDNSYVAKTKVYYSFAKNYLYTGVGYENFKATKKSAQKYINRNEIRLQAGIDYNLPSQFRAQVNYTYKQVYYTDEIINFGTTTLKPKRKDVLEQLELKVSHPLGQKYELFVLYEYLQNNSSNSLSNYKKHVSMFGISSTF